MLWWNCPALEAVSVRSFVILWKRTDDRINTFTKTKKLSTEELKLLLPEAQAGNELAVQRLCNGFAPLIFKLSYRPTVYKVLGDDAENTAWLWFLEFVNSYHGNKYSRFPGLVRRYLIFKFVRYMQQQGTRWDKEIFSETDDSENPLSGEEDDNYLRVLNSLALRQEFKRLSPKRQVILQRYFGKGQSQREIAELCHCSVRDVGYHKDMAVKQIRDKFYN